MLESIVDLLNGLFTIAMILLTAVCVVGSMVAALRAVSRGTPTSEMMQRKFVGDMGSQSAGPLDTRLIAHKAAESPRELSVHDDFKSCKSSQIPAVGAIPIGTHRSGRSITI
jgi:hypothetical protein